jgi:methylphosphotriester-DNA--protein-cysteine methyltransferase
MQGLCAAVQADPGRRGRWRAWPRSSGQREPFACAVPAEFGLSPQAWLSASRLRWAKHQLRTSAAPISDIALAAGYSEQSALTRALRRECGQTPAAWRRGAI